MKNKAQKVEMKDMEIQTETEVQAKPPPKKENDDFVSDKAREIYKTQLF